MTLQAILLFYLIGGFFAVLLNLVPVRMLWRMHPRGRKALVTCAVVGNFMWLVMPFLMRGQSTPFTRVFRSTLGPVWCLWTAFLLAMNLILAATALVFLIYGRRATRRTFTEFTRPISRVALPLLGVMFVVGVYQALVPLRVERVPVSISNLPRELEGFRIAQMSDLHVGYYTRLSRVDLFAEKINALDPDVAVISGDLIDDDPFYVPKLLRAMQNIRGDIPIAAVLGNHEMYGDPRAVIAGTRGSRLRLLVNESLPIEKNGRRLWIAGLSDFAAERNRVRAKELKPDIRKTLAGIPPEDMRVLLAHQPLAFPLAQQNGIPLTVVGHTHGGQFGLRVLNWSLAGVFLPYDMGLYERGAHQLYVNTGTGYWMLPFRFGMPPEITLLELRGR